MQSSREGVLALISRWQSEKCPIKVSFCTVDHALEITCPPILYAHLDSLDHSAFWLSEPGPRDGAGMLYGIHVKLTALDGYEITDVKTEAHSSFQFRVNFATCLRVPFGELGDLMAYETEKPDSKNL